MSIIDLIFPKICVGCSREGEYICQICQRELVRPEGICPMCSKPSLGGWTHLRCRQGWGMERLLVGLPYRGMVQDCLKRVKYKSAWEIIGFLYKMCARVSSPALAGLHPGFVITAVPMWSEKEWERGFNQAEMLADLLTKDLPGVSRKVEILARVRETQPMFGLSKKERQKNIEGAFRIITNNQVPIIKQTQDLNNQVFKRVILVDDVWTTGATMRECARVLKRSGVQEVWGITLAR